MARSPSPVGPTAATRARQRRVYSTILWWIFVGVFVYNAVVVGQFVFWIPAVGFALGAFATTRLALSARAPERFTPAPGAIAASRKGRPVTAPGQWVPPGGARPGTAQSGVLRAAAGRLSFETADGDTGFDVAITQIGLPTVPSFLRPQLDVELASGVHTIRLFPVWDLGATFVGPTVAQEWCLQLEAAGASGPA
ncbi:MAG: hypothetical protein MUE36_12515 [Acidimicrobiales bacterium]|jgi:hypothetical protein|nr:hypothetical protein [Acidimicrobiales bacterium]